MNISLPHPLQMKTKRKICRIESFCILMSQPLRVKAAKKDISIII